MAKSDDVGTRLLEARFEGNFLREVGEGNKPRVTIQVVAHQNREMSARCQDARTVANELLIACQKMLKRR